MIDFLIHSIKGKLLLTFFTTLCLTLLFQFVSIAPTLEKRKIKGIQDTQKGFSVFLAGEINSRLVDAAYELEQMAGLPGIASLDRELMDAAISTSADSNNFFNYYFVMDRNGSWLSYPTHPELIGKKIPKENMDWVDETFKSGKTIFMLCCLIYRNDIVVYQMVEPFQQCTFEG